MPGDINVDVSGRQVEARIRGSGAPTVVFELGGSGGTLSFWRMQISRTRCVLACL
jgi:hypothetical protein